MANGIGAGRALAIAGVVAAVAIGTVAFLRPVSSTLPESDDPERVAVPVAEVETGAASDAADADVSAAPQETPDLPAPPGGVGPQLDVIRIDAAGSAVVAGRGSLGADVILRLDGEEIASTKADDAGNFVSLFDMGVAEVPRILTVESRDTAGTVTRATESIIVAPTFPVAPTAATAPVIATTSQPIAIEGPGGDGEAGTVDEGQRTAGVSPAEEELSLPSDAASGSVVATAPAVVADAPELAPIGRATAVSEAPGGRTIAMAAVPAPRLFRAGPGGVSVIATSTEAPLARQDLGIDAITYDAAGDVSLAGTGARDSDLRIYLDNRPVQLVRVDQQGAWSSPLPNVESGVYTLRIDAMAEDGTVESRIETPFQRTAPEVAAASRRDGITAITVQPGYTLWAISEGYFGEGVQYVQIFENNRDQIRDPDLIFPGQVFNLPQTE